MDGKPGFGGETESHACSELVGTGDLNALSPPKWELAEGTETDYLQSPVLVGGEPMSTSSSTRSSN